MKQRIVFTTYSPTDDARAKQKIAEIATQQPNTAFIGRHGLSPNASQAAVQAAINRSQITLVLVGNNTLSCPRVLDDLQKSLSKQPANPVIYVLLDEVEELVKESLLGAVLHGCGAELSSAEPSELGDCLKRAVKVADLPTEVSVSKSSGCDRKC